MAEQQCYKISTAFNEEEREFLEQSLKLFSGEFCPIEPINIEKDEYVESEIGKMARQWQDNIGLSPDAVKNALKIERKSKGSGIWVISWVIAHEIGHYKHGDSEARASLAGDKLLDKVEKRIPGWE